MDKIVIVLIQLLALFMAIVPHGYVAWKLGDPTWNGLIQLQLHPVRVISVALRGKRSLAAMRRRDNQWLIFGSRAFKIFACNHGNKSYFLNKQGCALIVAEPCF